ncbi:hypothetical protein ACLMJK_000567 [Lecanora helva]
MAESDPDPSPQRHSLLTTLTNHIRSTAHSLHLTHRHDTSTLLSSPLSEISGSLGDLGTLLPLLIALTATNSISLPTTLVFSGLANILTGICFGIPLPVQPMKAIAAVAIAQGFGKEEMASAGLFVAGGIGVLSATGLVRWFAGVVPVPVVKGIQVGTGLSLVLSAGKLYPGSEEGRWVVLLVAFLGLLGSEQVRRVPYALVVFVVGVVAAVVSMAPAADQTYFGIWHPHTLIPSPESFRIGVLEAGIGQLPLTTLNSVIAVTFLAEDLLPEVKTPSTTSIGLSVAAINLVGCWFGAMPVCHGSGGLAAQYKFGARSGASIIFLGSVKLLLGLFASDLTFYIFNGFPNTLLCILLIAAGLELAKAGESLNTNGARDLEDFHKDEEQGHGSNSVVNGNFDSNLIEKKRRRWAVMFMTVAGILAFRNDAVGFLAGMLCHWNFQIQDWWQARQGRQQGQIRLEATEDLL